MNSYERARQLEKDHNNGAVFGAVAGFMAPLIVGSFTIGVLPALMASLMLLMGSGLALCVGMLVSIVTDDERFVPKFMRFNSRYNSEYSNNDKLSQTSRMGAFMRGLWKDGITFTPLGLAKLPFAAVSFAGWSAKKLYAGTQYFRDLVADQKQVSAANKQQKLQEQSLSAENAELKRKLAESEAANLNARAQAKAAAVADVPAAQPIAMPAEKVAAASVRPRVATHARAARIDDGVPMA